MHLALLAEFGGKGDRWVTIAENERQKAVGRNRELGVSKQQAGSGLRDIKRWIAGWGDTEIG
jgi:hypothetical protein